MLPPKITPSLRSAAVLGRRAAVLLVCTACADDITCVDLANCVYPEADAGARGSNASESVTSASSSNIGATTGAFADTSAGDEQATNASPTSSTRDGGDETTSSEQTAGDATSSDEPVGTCLETDTCECDEGTAEPCWETPDGTPITDNPEDAIGDCKLGQRTCEEGVWSACVGAVAPQEKDSCDRPLADDNCNGEVNEYCECTPTDTRTCGTDQGPCVAGVQTCGEDSQWEPECVGEVAPANEETCAVANTDANCNGEKNEGCECIGNEVEPCNDCGERACNPDTGRWGACQPVEDTRCSDDAKGIQVCNPIGNWQTQTCANDDETHCDVACTSSGGRPACVTTARDSDDDGFRAAACANAITPGNDCDDSTDLASPGSTELCDGIDNDCDGFADVRDSALRLAGVPIHLVGGYDMRRSDLAWHGSDFFVVADGKTANESTNQTNIYGGFSAASSAGTYGILNLARIIEGNSDYYYRAPRIESAGGVLGGVILMDGRSWGTNFVTLGNTGSLLTTMSIEGGPPGGGDLVKNGNAFAVTSHRAPTGLDSSYSFTFASGATNGSVSSVKTKTGMPGTVAQQSITQSGTKTAAIFMDEKADQEPSVHLMLWSNANNITGPIELAQPARTGGITTLASGDFAVAWATSGGFRLQVRATNGNDIVCDSQEIAFGDGTLDSLDGVALAETPVGLIVFATDRGTTQGRAELFVFGQDCQLESQAGKSVFNRDDETYDFDRPHLPRIALGQGKIGLAWTSELSNKTDEYRAYAMVLPDVMCE